MSLPNGRTKRREKSDPFPEIARRIRAMAQQHADGTLQRARVTQIGPIEVELFDHEGTEDIILSEDDDDFEVTDQARRTDIAPGDTGIVLREKEGWVLIGFLSDRDLWPISLTTDSRP